MSYNLESLVKILEQILLPHHHRWVLDPHKKPEIESLLEKARSLKEFFRNSSPVTSSKKESFEGRIRDATYEAEDVLESYAADQVLSVREGERFVFSPPSLEKVIGEFQSLNEEIKMMMDGIQVSDKTSPLPESSSRSDPNPKNILVGISEGAIQLKDRLSGQQSKLEVIPIVGMGGIGKTTLARNVYDDSFVIQRFDVRAWVTVSLDYDLRGILLGLLHCVVGKLTDDILKKKTDQLGLQLYQSLCGRRYLIVLDDMWNTKAWDDVHKFFPDYQNGSRIMLTTRESVVADCAGASHHQMHLLGKDDSWNLLREKVFAQETCPPELETIGKKIANGCKGLPLAIHVIGGLLSQAKKARAYWVQVARDVSSVVACEDKQFSKVLSLSYAHLPNHLKPCFLYMGAFPEDYEIRASRIIMLWVAEGFLEPTTDGSLEEAAAICLKDLVGRNLIFVRHQEPNGIVKSYGVHDLLREVSVTKAREESFLYSSSLNNTEYIRRLSRYQVLDLFNDSTEFMKLSRSFLFTSPGSGVILGPVVFGLQLLRVLDIYKIEFYKFPEEVLQLVNLRYLALTCGSDLRSSLSTLGNLETIIIRYNGLFRVDSSLHFTFPRFGNLPLLRHIKFKRMSADWITLFGSTLPENLRTLYTITVKDDFHTSLESVPNLKQLGIYGFYTLSGDIDLTCLHKLETLKCSSDMSPESLSFVSLIRFPSSLKKLSLLKCVIQSGCMEKIGALPNLEILKVRDCTLKSSTWELNEVEFSQLQLLLLENSNLEKWAADKTNFPRLKHLLIRSCSKLEEIPSGIGEIPTLELIEVYKCSTSVEASARKIEEEQDELGNYGLQVRITT